MCRRNGSNDALLVDDADAARRRYKKDLDLLKPDLVAYNKQKEQALGLPAGTLVKAGNSSSSISQFDPNASSVCICPLIEGDGYSKTHRLFQQVNSNDSQRRTYTETPTAYCMLTTSRAKRRSTASSVRSIESMCLYTWYKCGSDQVYSIDKKSKFSRKRNNEDEGDITYINERNRVFNKKVGITLSRARNGDTHPLSHVHHRSHDTTTNILRKSVRASSVGLHYDVLVQLLLYYLYCISPWLIIIVSPFLYTTSTIVSCQA